MSFPILKQAARLEGDDEKDDDLRTKICMAGKCVDFNVVLFLLAVWDVEGAAGKGIINMAS